MPDNSVNVFLVMFYTILWLFSVNPELLTKSQRVNSFLQDLAVLSGTHEAFKYDSVYRNRYR